MSKIYWIDIHPSEQARRLRQALAGWGFEVEDGVGEGTLLIVADRPDPLLDPSRGHRDPVVGGGRRPGERQRGAVLPPRLGGAPEPAPGGRAQEPGAHPDPRPGQRGLAAADAAPGLPGRAAPAHPDARGAAVRRQGRGHLDPQGRDLLPAVRRRLPRAPPLPARGGRPGADRPGLAALPRASRSACCACWSRAPAPSTSWASCARWRT